MGREIERKFLVRGEAWRALGVGVRYVQGYLCDRPTVRVRLAGEKAYLTIKGPYSQSGRAEFEYAIPVADAEEMLNTLCHRPLIEKVRYRIPFDDVTWEVDEFGGENQGLILAEVELSSPTQPIVIPDWIGLEVTQDARYYNSNLVTYPYSQWSN